VTGQQAVPLPGAAEPDTVRATVPSDPRYLPLVRAVVEKGATAAGFGPEDCDRISLAVTEGVTNVIRHSYHGDPNRRIDLVLHTPAGLFRLEIRDYGRFVDPARIASRPLDEVRPGGLGVHLMKATMDSVEYERNAHGGTTLTLVKRGRGPEKDRA
jgi:anti-sigma regulatory factor (Ser/Thr protein kinase)